MQYIIIIIIIIIIIMSAFTRSFMKFWNRSLPYSVQFCVK
jgi:hypothetical protein